jgi:ABC-type antimicrobial peptide transport system permease subunit
VLKSLSVWKYYQHNRRKVNVVFIITFLSVLLQYTILISVSSIINFDMGTFIQFSKSVAIIRLINVTQENRNRIIKLLTQQSAIAKIIPFEGAEIPMSIGKGLLVFLKKSEIKPLMQTLNLKLTQGRLPKPGSHGAVLHWRIAANKKLKIGAFFSEKISQDGLLTKKYQLTGILDGKLLIGLADLDQYIQNYQLPKKKSPLLIVPQPGQLAVVKQYLGSLSQRNSKVELKNLDSESDISLIINIIHLLIMGIAAICSGFLFYLYFYQRRSEFGLLEALGHTRPMLVGRAFREILLLNLLGFCSALGIALVTGWTINRFFLLPQGLALVLWEPGYLIKLLSTPLFVSCCTLIPVWRLLKKVDPISIIEGTSKYGIQKAKMNKPLSTWIYWHNHQKRVGIIFMVSFLSLILQGILLIYTTSLIKYTERVTELLNKTTWTYLIKHSRKELGHLRKSLARHPSVANVLTFYIKEVNHLPGFETPYIFCIDAAEIEPLMGYFNLKLIKGRLPTPGSHEVIMHWQLAANQRIKIGDHFGKVFGKGKLVRVKFHLVGLLDGQAILGFSGLEQISAACHRGDLPLLIIPKKGQSMPVKRYLAKLMQKNKNIITSATEEKNSLESLSIVKTFFNCVYFTIAVIVSLGVGFLFYLYFYQRRPEFGMLEALGHTRKMIVGRVFQEIWGITLLALGLGLTITYLGGWILNRVVLSKHGLPMVLWDPDYPVKLLLLPLMLTFGSLIPVWRMLAKVDPITMIEGAE